MVFAVTRSTRDYVIEQMPALVATYFVAVGLILAAACIDGVVAPQTVGLWLAESVASLAARLLAMGRLVRASPVEIAAKPWLRLLPLLAIVLAAIHWSWTATLFIGPHLDLTTVVVLLVYVMLSIACLGLVPVSPLVCAAYVVPMWVATAWMLAVSDWVSTPILLALAAALAGILWSNLSIAIGAVRRHLLRSDEIELLMSELRERNAEIEVLRSTAAADLETRATVFASASHDLRQRIHALKLLAHVHAAGSDPGRAVQRIASAIEELEVFVTDVLLFVRFDSSRERDQLVNVPLQEVLQGVELHFEAIALEKKVRLRTRATPLAIRTNAVMLGRVIENLVSNAVKFTRRDVLIAARRLGDDIALEVWDQGEGLDPSTADRQPEAKHTAARIGGNQGFGLGLAIVRNLVEALGYRIEVASRAGYGTRFRIVIPSRFVVKEAKP